MYIRSELCDDIIHLTKLQLSTFGFLVEMNKNTNFGTREKGFTKVCTSDCAGANDVWREHTQLCEVRQ